MPQLRDSYATYVALCADPLHHGHINVIEYAKRLHRTGGVIVGLLTDEAIASYKQPPMMKYEDRYRVVSCQGGGQGYTAGHTGLCAELAGVYAPVCGTWRAAAGEYQERGN